MSGKLIVGGVGIGNFKDIPQRTMESVESCDLIVAEHGESFKRFLDNKNKKYRGEIINYLPELENRAEIIKHVIDSIVSGKDVLLLSQEGMPLIHDPGFEIVKAVVEAELRITVIPGPTAPIAALCVSGFSTEKFIFESDVPQNTPEAMRVFSDLKYENRTTIFFDKIINLKRSLYLLSQVIGETRRVCICINLTQGTERIITKQIKQAIEWTNEPDFQELQFRDVKVVLVVEGVNIWVKW